jgi:hypothetical protein
VRRAPSGALAAFVSNVGLPRPTRARKIDRVSPHRRAGLGVLLTAACTPDIDPAWLVTGPRELVLDVEVVTQGPYGVRIPEGPRSARDALPLDTLRLRPAVVDTGGPLDPDALESTWLMCAGIGSCLLQGSVGDRPACTGEELQPSEPCRFFEGGTAMLTLADVPLELVSEASTVFDLIDGPTISYIASAPEGPGLQECIARFDARERLEGCLLMERALGLGPLGELVDVLRGLGIEPGIGEDAETLLARPRNHNPAVDQFRVEIGGETMVVAAGSRVSVPRNEAIVLTVETTDADLDGYDVIVGDETATLEDDLDAQWWLDREVELEAPAYGQPWVRWRAGPVTGTVRAYAALRDGRGGEGWGWLDLEIDG